MASSCASLRNGATHNLGALSWATHSMINSKALPQKKLWLISAVVIVGLILLVSMGPPLNGLKQSVLTDATNEGLRTETTGDLQETHALLNSNHYIPRLGWGSFHTGGDLARRAVKDAVDAGFRHIDTAQVYGNEQDLGKGLRDLYRAKTVKREDLFITSKLWDENHAYDAVLPAVQGSLSDLQTDYLDLYLIHWPKTNNSGPLLEPSLNETWTAMENLVDRGLVKSIGVSNFSPEKIQEILKNARIHPAVNQVEVHCHFRNDRVVQWCEQAGIHVTAYAPLSSPQTMANSDVPNLLLDEEVARIAEKNGRTVAQTLLRWGLQRGTSVIPKSDKKAHSQENQGVWGWELDEADMDALSSIQPQIKYFEGDLDPAGPYHNYEELWDESRP